jgi:hypothetical protein
LESRETLLEDHICFGDDDGLIYVDVSGLTWLRLRGRVTLVFPAHILNAESEYGKVPLPHLQKQYGELGVNMGS